MRRSAHILDNARAQTGAILARNPYATAFAGEVAFADLGAAVTSVTTDRASFWAKAGDGRAASACGGGFVERIGPAPAPCAALQRGVTLEAGESVEIVFLPAAASAEAAGEVIMRYREPDAIAAALAEVGGYWADLLGGGASDIAGSRDGHHAQRVVALSDIGLPDLGAGGVLSGQRRLRVPRPVARRMASPRCARR